jgi:selenocysteine-specific translation elongation factor
MIQLLTKGLGEFPLVAANKIDKTSKEAIDANLKEFTQQIGSSENSPIENCIFPVSAKTGEGLGYLKNAIHERLVAKGNMAPFELAS